MPKTIIVTGPIYCGSSTIATARDALITSASIWDAGTAVIDMVFFRPRCRFVWPGTDANGERHNHKQHGDSRKPSHQPTYLQARFHHASLLSVAFLCTVCHIIISLYQAPSAATIIHAQNPAAIERTLIHQRHFCNHLFSWYEFPTFFVGFILTITFTRAQWQIRCKHKTQTFRSILIANSLSYNRH